MENKDILIPLLRFKVQIRVSRNMILLQVDITRKVFKISDDFFFHFKKHSQQCVETFFKFLINNIFINN